MDLDVTEHPERIGLYGGIHPKKGKDNHQGSNHQKSQHSPIGNKNQKNFFKSMKHSNHIKLKNPFRITHKNLKQYKNKD